MCHCPSGRCGLKYSTSISFDTSILSLSFGTVWIEMSCSRIWTIARRSLSFGTVWIEIQAYAKKKITERVTVLRDGVD